MRISDWSSDVCSSDLDLAARMDEALVMRPDADRVDLVELTLKLGFGEFLHRLGIHDRGLGGDEGQLEGLQPREAARRVARQRPSEVDDAVAYLIEELRRLPAELHGRKDPHGDTAVRLRLELLRRSEEHTS